MRTLAVFLLNMAISPFSNGRKRTGVTGTAISVLLLLIMAVSLVGCPDK
jgi:hypothetical protein